MIELPTLPVVLVTAAIDAINPCAIGVLVLLLATLIKMSHDKKRLIITGSIYITAVFVTYLLAGLGMLYFIQILGMASIVSYIVAGIILILGFIELRDAYAKKPLLAISSGHAKTIMKWMNQITIPGSILLGAFVAVVELPCTGGPYLAITTLLAKQGFSIEVFGLLVLYNFIFVLPLIIILLLVLFGANVKKIQAWKDQEKKKMRITIGLILIVLSILLFLQLFNLITV